MSRQHHECQLLLATYCDAYKAVYGHPYWRGRSVLQGKPDESLTREIEKLLEFLHTNNARVDYHNDAWKGYIKFALRNFSDKGIMPRPSSLKSKGLLRAYCLSVPQTQQYNLHLHRVDYRKVLDPEFRTTEFMTLLGLGNANQSAV
jgi:hypothetical protein